LTPIGDVMMPLSFDWKARPRRESAADPPKVCRDRERMERKARKGTLRTV